MQRKNIKSVLEKINSGDLSPEEETMAKYWLHHLNLKNQSGYSDDGLERVSDEMWNFLEKEKPTSPRTVKLWPRWLAAASIAIAVMTGGYFYYTSQSDKDKTDLSAFNDIAPGKNGATLTLANGKKILINDALAGNLAEEAGVRISKNKDGEIIYEVIGDDGSLAYNTLTTTRGEQTQVRLPDGTLVFLNAESSLRYPNNFSHTKRRIVSLIGEGYFEVTKDKSHPFIVDTKRQSVEVLGTHFNVNAYENNEAVSTTLLEGSVRVSGVGKVGSKILRPGQQAKLSQQSISVADVEVEDAVAWKNGDFVYNGETLENIMKDVARWYNVEVVFKDNSIKKEIYFVFVSRFAKVSQLLKLLSRTEAVTFEVKGNTITIDKKSK